MNAQTVESLEGRLMAHRKLIAMILSTLRDSPELWSKIEDRLEVRDHEEDPGVIPSEAFAIEAALADEIRLVLRTAREI